MGLDLLLKNSMNSQHSLRCTNGAHIVLQREQRLSSRDLVLASTNALCNLRQKSRGREGRPALRPPGSLVVPGIRRRLFRKTAKRMGERCWQRHQTSCGTWSKTPICF